MCGLPYSLEEVQAATDSSENNVIHTDNAAYQSMTAPNGGEDQLSVTYWINKASDESKFPIICAYAGKDSIVGINQYATLQTTLDNKGITYYTANDHRGYIYFRNSEHSELTESADSTHYHELIDAVDAWCTAALA